MADRTAGVSAAVRLFCGVTRAPANARAQSPAAVSSPPSAPASAVEEPVASAIT